MKTLKQRIEEAAEEYAFQVPYDGTKEFYSQTKLFDFKAGAQFMLNEGYRFTKEDMIDFVEYCHINAYKPEEVFGLWLKERGNGNI